MGRQVSCCFNAAALCTWDANYHGTPRSLTKVWAASASPFFLLLLSEGVLKCLRSDSCVIVFIFLNAWQGDRSVSPGGPEATLSLQTRPEVEKKAVVMCGAPLRHTACRKSRRFSGVWVAAQRQIHRVILRLRVRCCLFYFVLFCFSHHTTLLTVSLWRFIFLLHAVEMICAD